MDCVDIGRKLEFQPLGLILHAYLETADKTQTSAANL